MAKFERKTHEESREGYSKLLDKIEKEREGKPMKVTTEVLLNQILGEKRKKWKFKALIKQSQEIVSELGGQLISCSLCFRWFYNSKFKYFIKLIQKSLIFWKIWYN